MTDIINPNQVDYITKIMRRIGVFFVPFFKLDIEPDWSDIMAKISVTKRGKFYQYRFQLASQNGQRKWFSKSGFKTKKEAEAAGITE